MNMHKIDANSLLQKAKNQKTAAWILVAGGAVISTVGFIIVTNEVVKDLSNIFTPNYSTSNSTSGEIMVYAGTGAMPGSIHCSLGPAKIKEKRILC